LGKELKSILYYPTQGYGPDVPILKFFGGTFSSFHLGSTENAYSL
jgi:hypothetical protein